MAGDFETVMTCTIVSVNLCVPAKKTWCCCSP